MKTRTRKLGIITSLFVFASAYPCFATGVFDYFRNRKGDTLKDLLIKVQKEGKAINLKSGPKILNGGKVKAYIQGKPQGVMVQGSKGSKAKESKIQNVDWNVQEGIAEIFKDRQIADSPGDGLCFYHSVLICLENEKGGNEIKIEEKKTLNFLKEVADRCRNVEEKEPKVAKPVNDLILEVIKAENNFRKEKVLNSENQEEESNGFYEDIKKEISDEDWDEYVQKVENDDYTAGHRRIINKEDFLSLFEEGKIWGNDAVASLISWFIQRKVVIISEDDENKAVRMVSCFWRMPDGDDWSKIYLVNGFSHFRPVVSKRVETVSCYDRYGKEKRVDLPLEDPDWLLQIKKGN